MAAINSDSIYDPLGIEIFAIDETFESLFNGLKGVYFRLYYKESKCSGVPLHSESKNIYFKRYREIARLKRSYQYNDWISKKQAVEIYSKEFKEMIRIELESFPSFMTNL
ncbi:hypothetical protein [Mucilaginibacter sp. SG564]|uniref:hypothetical protein n=1 Tax=Mucilaginibacter sp. SG564 TaxID=2587022 RepID=UPI0015567832|nr:hypothetical protein [Mucilaginibacter sp. SG564]NOW94764.1 hypothetical protein [Mucilaginibacter sp. SG564]